MTAHTTRLSGFPAKVVLMTCCLGIAAYGATTTDQMLAYLTEHSSERATFDGKRVTSLYSSGALAVDADPTTDTDHFVDSCLAQHAPGLGISDLTLVLRDKINVHDKFLVYTYTQTIGGLPVHNSLVKVPVLLGSEERISYIGARLVQAPDNGFAPDIISGAEAIQAVAAMAQFAGLDTFSSPELAVYEAADDIVRRVWRFIGTGGGRSYQVFVDTNSPVLVGWDDLVSHFGVTGTVTGFGTTGTSADCQIESVYCPPESVRALEEFALPGIRVSASNGMETYASDGGVYTLPVPSDQTVTISASLVGEYVIVETAGGDAFVESAAGIQSPATNVDLRFNDEPIGPGVYPEIPTAAVNAFLAGQTTGEWWARYQPNLPLLEQPLLITVDHASPECSAQYYDNPPHVENARSTVGCNDLAFSVVQSHEYGHYVFRSLVGYHTGESAFHEGSSDAVAALIWGTPSIGEDTGIGGMPRELGASDIQLTCTIPPPGCTGGENVCMCTDGLAHCCGLAFAGSVWDARELLRDAYPTDFMARINQTFADFAVITDGTFDDSLLLEMLIADDTDGDLSNGTLNEAEIRAGFAAHGFDDPTQSASGVLVSWDNPMSNPQEGLDYILYDNVSPPIVVLRTTRKDDFTIGLWEVGRVVNGQPADLGTVTASWLAPATNDIQVYVGNAHPCASVYVVEIPAQSPQNWSSIVLNLTGHLYAHAQCYPDETGAGGLISGDILGAAQRLLGAGIGLGDAAPATLTIHGSLGRAYIGTIAGSSTLRVEAGLDDLLVVNGPVNGTLSVNAIRYQANDPLRLKGGIRIETSEGSTGDITIGDGSPNPFAGLRGGFVTIEGPFSGMMTVNGMTRDVFGSVVPTIRVGDLSGTLTVADSTAALVGTIQIGSESQSATVLPGGQIDLETLMGGEARVDVFGSVSGGGRIWLSGGMAPGSQVDVHGNLEGTIELLGASNELSGTIEIAQSGAPGNITSTGLLTIEPQVTGSETLVVHGNVDTGGRVQLKNGVADGGSIRIAGDLGGTLEIGAPVVFGGTLAGGVNVDGAVSGTISHYGLATSTGTIDLGSVASNGRYTQTLTNPTGPWAGSLAVHDDMAGTVQFSTVLQGAEVTIGGNIPGAASLTIRELYDSIVNLNFHACQVSTSGTVNIGHTTTVWQPNANGTVDLGDIRMFGDFAPTGRINFYGCKRSGVTWQHMSELCFEQHAWGQINNYLCKPKPQIDQCPLTVIEDPCVQ